MSNLIFRAFLSGIAWDIVIRRLEVNERASGVGDGKIEGHRYTIIHRNGEILIILPDYEPREKCHEVVKKILSKLVVRPKIDIVTMGYASSCCNYCLKPTSLPYKCYRCCGWYCETHRLPEKHNCPGEKEGRKKAARRIKPKTERKTEKVVVTEIPCG